MFANGGFIGSNYREKVMRHITHINNRVNKIEKLLKNSKLDPATEQLVDYEVARIISDLDRLYEVVYMHTIQSTLITGNDPVFSEVLKVRELAEQHYKEEDNENE